MAFHFTLAPLLRLRQSIERQRSLRLQEASMELARVHDALAQLEQFLANSALSDEASLAAGRTAAELQFAALFRRNLCELQRDLQGQLRELELQRQKAAAEYQRAFREREVLETLRSRQRRAFQQETERREQRELDATHLLQLWHNRDG